MKHYKNLTEKYLKENKKRTVFTILGVVLSVALITTVGIFLKGMQNNLIEQNKKNYGSYHIMIKNADHNLINNLKSNPKIKNIGIMQQSKNKTILKNSTKLSFVKMNEVGMKITPFKVEKGKLPSKKNEVAVEEWALQDYSKDEVKIGDNIDLKLENGETKTLKLTGLLLNTIKGQEKNVSMALVKDVDFIDGSKNAFIEISEKANLKETISELRKLVSKDKFYTNDHLLALLGASSNETVNNAITAIAIIVITIIIIATIAVIYNSFQISIMQRMKELGLLRAIGTTPKQIKNIVLREATFMVLIGIPLGLILGIIAMLIVAIVFNQLNSSMSKDTMTLAISVFKTPPIVFLISSLVGVFSVYISALLPARSAGKVPPLVAVNNENHIKKVKINKISFFVSKLLRKIDLIMAYRNIKRNKKRFNITVFSMTISITIFIIFSSMARMGENFTDKVDESSKMDFTINFSKGLRDKSLNAMSKDLKKVDGIKDIYINYNSVNMNSIVDYSDINSLAKKIDPNSFKEKVTLDGKEKVKTFIFFQGYDDNKLKLSKNYVKEGEIDKDKFNKENGVILVRNYSLYSEKEKKSYNTSVVDFKVGDYIYVDSNLKYKKSKNGESEEIKKDKYSAKDLSKVKVLAIVDDNPFGNASSLFTVITTKDVLNNLIKNNDYKKDEFKTKSIGLRLKNKKDEKKVSKSLNKLLEKETNGTLINNIQQLREQNSNSIQTLILMYGFVVVITLIGSINIINTINTNLILRKKEFASLRAIGMSMKNIKRMISLEGILYGVISSIYGCILGNLGSYLLYSQMMRVSGFAFKIYIDIIIIATLGSIIIGYLSTLIPLKKLTKENIIESMRGE